MLVERILKGEPVTEDDQYSDDPQRRKLFCIHSAASEIHKFVTNVREDLSAFPKTCRAILQEGEDGGTVAYLAALPQSIPVAYRELGVATIGEIKAIVREKGFRFKAALFSSREHKTVGSSGYGGIYWETDPDVPIPLLHTRLAAAGLIVLKERDTQNTMTIDEADHARRLVGMTRLDLTTGRVTKEVDKTAAADSYYFLSPGRRVEVINREQELMVGVEEITRQTIDEHSSTQDFLCAMIAYGNGKMLTPELQARYKEILSRASERHQIVLVNQLRDLKQIVFETGLRDFMLTPQEILLREGGVVDSLYLAQPYVPLAVQDGLSAAEIAKLRRGENSMVVNANILEYSMSFGFRLEELNEEGQTIKSPTFLDVYGDKIAEEDEEYRTYFGPLINVPFARPGDWFYKGD